MHQQLWTWKDGASVTGAAPIQRVCIVPAPPFHVSSLACHRNDIHDVGCVVAVKVVVSGFLGRSLDLGNRDSQSKATEQTLSCTLCARRFRSSNKVVGEMRLHIS
jgi:hypothetical protein